MTRSWTFGHKIALGFTTTVGFAVLVGVIAVLALRSVVATMDHVIAVNSHNLIEAAMLGTASEQRSSAARGFLLTREERFLVTLKAARADFMASLGGLKAHVNADSSKRLVDQIERTEAEYQIAMEHVIEARKAEATIEAVSRLFEEQVMPKRDALNEGVRDLLSSEERLLGETRRDASDTASSAISGVLAVTVGAVLFAGAVAYCLARGLARQIASAIQHVQSSASELQAAANQQASGAREQATAVSEISTTITELLATSRQIAESAQRVAQIADQTATAAQNGDQTVQKGQDAGGGIKRQVDLIVTHMLDLGKKAQQIGGILEIINELAEQTNILSINATIEAAGAGEAGKRFAVVADEIRKLADRVGGATKDIRELVDETRSAVNTTVMATESGSKAVDAGSRQFDEVALAFKHIADLVRTTTEAAREIELSTKQQTTAVEQVNAAIAEVAVTTKETEANSSQTFQTATQLSSLSRELTRFIRPTAVS